jgi:hypothetical protein
LAQAITLRALGALIETADLVAEMTEVEIITHSTQVYESLWQH